MDFNKKPFNSALKGGRGNGGSFNPRPKGRGN